MKVIIVFAVIGIMAALASAGFFMLRRRGNDKDARAPDKRMARALALRVAISVGLFVVILLAWYMGWISPKGLPSGR